MGESKTKEYRRNYELATARGNIYKYLASMYLTEPTKEYLDKTLANNVIKNLEMIFTKKPIAQLRKFVKKIDNSYEDVVQEFRDLFIVPLDRYVAPYESVFLTGLASQEPTVEVGNIYANAGAELKPTSFATSPDYIGFELDFMCFLCEQEANGWKSRKVKKAKTHFIIQKNFLVEHLLKWVDKFEKKVAQNAKFDLYKAVAQMTKQYLKNDLKEVKKLKL